MSETNHPREELCAYLRKCSRAGTAHNQAADLLEADAAEIARLRAAIEAWTKRDADQILGWHEIILSAAKSEGSLLDGAPKP